MRWLERFERWLLNLRELHYEGSLCTCVVSGGAGDALWCRLICERETRASASL